MTFQWHSHRWKKERKSQQGIKTTKTVEHENIIVYLSEFKSNGFIQLCIFKISTFLLFHFEMKWVCVEAWLFVSCVLCRVCVITIMKNESVVLRSVSPGLLLLFHFSVMKHQYKYTFIHNIQHTIEQSFHFEIKRDKKYEVEMFLTCWIKATWNFHQNLIKIMMCMQDRWERERGLKEMNNLTLNLSLTQWITYNVESDWFLSHSFFESSSKIRKSEHKENKQSLKKDLIF